MCHHVDMAIDWEEAVRKPDSATEEPDEFNESDEPAVDGETPREVTLPADD